jgi:integrase/recombinase XerC
VSIPSLRRPGARGPAEVVVPDPGDKRHVGAEARGGYRLVRAFPARQRFHRAAEDGLAGGGDARHGHHEVRVRAPNDHQTWFFRHLRQPSEVGFVTRFYWVWFADRKLSRDKRRPLDTRAGRLYHGGMNPEHDAAPAGVLVAATPSVGPSLVEAFLSGRNARTLRAYRQDLEAFRSFVGSDSIEQVVQFLVSQPHGDANRIALGYKASLVEQGLQAATVNRRLAALRAVVKLARLLGLVPWSLEIENLPNQPYRDTRGPGGPGVRRLLAVLDGRPGAKGARDLAILRLLYDLGLRRSEVVELDLADVDLEAGRVAVRGKGRTQKVSLSLPAATAAALARWLALRGAAAGPLFTNFDRAGRGAAA